MKEEWRPVAFFEGSYEVSNLGRVRSLDRIVPHLVNGRLARGRILAPRINMRRVGPYSSRVDYPMGQIVKLRCDGVEHYRPMGQLVLTAFSRPPVSGECARHRDLNPLNNRLDNLYWGQQEDTRENAIAAATGWKPVQGLQGIIQKNLAARRRANV